MRSIWVDNGQDAPYHALRANGITEPVYDVRDPRVTLAYLDSVQAMGFAPGLYLCSQGEGWPSHLTTSATDWASWAYETVLRIAPGTSGSYPKVHLNTETSDPDWLVAMIRHWRSHSPRRETFLLIEGRKAGIFQPAHVRAIDQSGVWLCPELCQGDMTPHPEGFVTLPMLRAGFSAKTLYGVFDAAHLPYDWSGVAFTAGRLPA